MSKWDYLFEADARLRALYRKTTTGNLADVERYTGEFNRIIRARAKNETARIMEEITKRILKDGELGWGKSGAYHDEGSAWDYRGRWVGLVPEETAKSWEIGNATEYAYLSTPLKIKSKKSQLEIIRLVLYYSKDLSTETYELLPAWIHSNTNDVIRSYITPSIRKLFPNKPQGMPTD